MGLHVTPGPGSGVGVGLVRELLAEHPDWTDDQLTSEAIRLRQQRELEAHALKVRELAERRRQLETSFAAKVCQLLGPSFDMNKLGDLEDLFRQHFEEQNELY